MAAIPSPRRDKWSRATDQKLAAVDDVLRRLEELAEELRGDPDRLVRRAASDLRAAFENREAVEPAVLRLRRSVDLLRQENRDGRRREFQRRAPGLEHLQAILRHELLPHLRRLGFEV